ncbi:Uncharacterized protein Fot_27505 [Forsythia ovata]|uniref:Uncharacterized protein n=1 Tax=Forsythia ovata TaxID=205694 RepID=A0ABD1TLI7_9LAMI
MRPKFTPNLNATFPYCIIRRFRLFHAYSVHIITVNERRPGQPANKLISTHRSFIPRKSTVHRLPEFIWADLTAFKKPAIPLLILAQSPKPLSSNARLSGPLFYPINGRRLAIGVFKVRRFR